MEGNVNILLVRFRNEIANSEVAMFRGAVINAVDDSDVLFHNHTDGDGFRYAYPLIQYKRINRKAAITCIGEGTEAIGKFFSSCNFDVTLGDRNMTLEVESVRAHKTLVQVWDSVFTYHLRKWLPLNQENYRKYEALDSIVERYAFLERLLTGNILSFAKSMGVYFDKQVECKITSADEPRIVNYKGVKMMSFDVEFKSNVSLPDYIGLGKGVSLGFGMVVRKYEKKNDNSNE
ncbi:MAG: hypothetical protein IJJ78_06165 [Paludibacteraceae bacterium]|nr:hypothetical protein [Paludibacteraceae bacterium]